MMMKQEKDSRWMWNSRHKTRHITSEKYSMEWTFWSLENDLKRMVKLFLFNYEQTFGTVNLYEEGLIFDEENKFNGLNENLDRLILIGFGTVSCVDFGNVSCIESLRWIMNMEITMIAN